MKLGGLWLQVITPTPRSTPFHSTPLSLPPDPLSLPPPPPRLQPNPPSHVRPHSHILHRHLRLLQTHPPNNHNRVPLRYRFQRPRRSRDFREGPRDSRRVRGEEEKGQGEADEVVPFAGAAFGEAQVEEGSSRLQDGTGCGDLHRLLRPRALPPRSNLLSPHPPLHHLPPHHPNNPQRRDGVRRESGTDGTEGTFGGGGSGVGEDVRRDGGGLGDGDEGAAGVGEVRREQGEARLFGGIGRDGGLFSVFCFLLLLRPSLSAF